MTRDFFQERDERFAAWAADNGFEARVYRKPSLDGVGLPGFPHIDGFHVYDHGFTAKRHDGLFCPVGDPYISDAAIEDVRAGLADSGFSLTVVRPGWWLPELGGTTGLIFSCIDPWTAYKWLRRHYAAFAHWGRYYRPHLKPFLGVESNTMNLFRRQLRED